MPSGLRARYFGGMFSFRPSRFGGGEDPWFRVGTFDIGSSGIAAIVVFFGILLWTAEGPGHAISSALNYSAPGVKSGEVWRLFTWPIPNAISIWALLSGVIIYLLGGQLEAATGKIKMAQFLVVLVFIPSILALALNLAGIAGTPLSFFGGSFISSALFYSYVAYLPTAKFWFGIPGWVFAAVFFGLEVLGAIAERNLGALLFVIGRVALWLLAAKAFGLADDAHWIPDPRSPGTRTGGGGSGGMPRPRGRSKRSKADLSVVGPPVDNFDEMGIDAILDQVSANGVDSLSSAQKKKLKEYSKQRKKRG